MKVPTAQLKLNIWVIHHWSNTSTNDKKAATSLITQMLRNVTNFNYTLYLVTCFPLFHQKNMQNNFLACLPFFPNSPAISVIKKDMWRNVPMGRNKKIPCASFQTFWNIFCPLPGIYARARSILATRWAVLVNRIPVYSRFPYWWHDWNCVTTVSLKG